MKNTSVEIHVDILKYTQNNTLVLPSLRSLELFSPRSSSAALSVPVSERGQHPPHRSALTSPLHNEQSNHVGYCSIVQVADKFLFFLSCCHRDAGTWLGTTKRFFFLHKTQQLQNEYIILDFSLYHKLFVFSPISHIC